MLDCHTEMSGQAERHWLNEARLHAQEAHFHRSRAAIMRADDKPAAALVLEQQADDCALRAANAILESAFAFDYEPPPEYYKPPV